MRPTTIELTGSGSGATSSAPVRVDWRAAELTLGFKTDGSTTGFTAQYTTDSPDGYASAAAWGNAATWEDVTDIDGVTANASKVIAGAVQGVRLSADANGTDTGTLTIITSYR